MTEYPSIYHPDIGEYIEIRNELAFKAARVVWDDIAAKYGAVTIPAGGLEHKDPVQVKPALLNPPKHPHQSRKGVPGWSDEEELIIKTAVDRDQAWSLYKKALPGKRNSNAVKQKWSKMHPKTTPEPVSKRPDTRKLGKKGLVKRLPESNSVNESVKAIPLIDDVKQSIQPSELPELKLRQKVKHNGLISSPYHHQIGVVDRMPPGGDILVKFDNGGTGWIPRDDLEIVGA